MEARQGSKPHRAIRASVLLAQVAAAQRLGLLDEVRKHASPALREKLDRPPLVTTLLPGELIDDLNAAVAAAGGRDAVVNVMLDCLRVQLGPMLRSLVESTKVLYGPGPAVLLAHLGTIAAPLVSGYAFSWEPDGPRSGVVTLRPDSKVTPTTFAVWDGVVLYFVELGGEKGKIVRSQLRADGLLGTIQVAW